MTARKNISKKLRFEVFKRDSFTCQYCGAKAPHVLLQADHIDPVANGGEDDLLNLVTSCEPCNAGKGPRTLDDQSTVEKQRRQLADLQERREQIEMMLSWRQGLVELDDEQTKIVQIDYSRLTGGWELNENGKSHARKWIKRFGLMAVLRAMEDAFAQYGWWEEASSMMEGRSVDEAWAKVPSICRMRESYGDDPRLPDLLYIQGILRKRLRDRQLHCVEELQRAADAGAPIVAMRAMAKRAESWEDFRWGLSSLSGAGGGEA